MVRLIRSRTWLSWANCRSGLLLAMLTFIGGCALRSAESTGYYALDYPPPVRHSGDSVPDTLMVYRFALDPSVDDYALTVIKPKGSDKTQVLYRWQDHPADMVTDLIRRDLDRSGLFKRTVDHFSTAPYRYALEGTVRDLQAVVSNGKILTQLQVDVNLIDFNAPQNFGRTLLGKSYHAEVPASDTTSAAIVAALNQGISQFSSQLRSDIRDALHGKKLLQ
jgi:ABC-type uncharacterized transport system auxiliary subunit